MYLRMRLPKNYLNIVDFKTFEKGKDYLIFAKTHVT
jgi:hypothetical protein